MAILLHGTQWKVLMLTKKRRAWMVFLIKVGEFKEDKTWRFFKGIEGLHLVIRICTKIRLLSKWKNWEPNLVKCPVDQLCNCIRQSNDWDYLFYWKNQSDLLCKAKDEERLCFKFWILQNWGPCRQLRNLPPTMRSTFSGFHHSCVPIVSFPTNHTLKTSVFWHQGTTSFMPSPPHLAELSIVCHAIV